MMNAGPPMDAGPGAAGPTAEDVMAADQAAAVERMQMVADEAPTPEGQGIPVAVLNTILEQINAVTAAINAVIGEEAVPRVTWSPGSVKNWQSQIPPEIFLPVVALVGTASQLGFSEHVFDPQAEFATAGSARGIASKLKNMASDERFIEAAAGANNPNAPIEAEPAPPEPLSPEDQRAQDDLFMEAM